MRFLGANRVIAAAYLVCMLVFLKGVSKSWHRDTGFTSMIRFGSKFEDRSLDTLKRVPHKVLADSYGYDGQFYAQLALSPALADPQLPSAIDNVAYRSRRILFSWTAWLLGLGRPEWIIHVYAVQNVLTWFASALLLCYWLPPTSWFHFGRWTAILFSSGMLTSVSNALLDGPAFLLLLLSVWLAERGWRGSGLALLGISALGKETNLLGAAAFVKWPLEKPWSARTLVGGLLLLALPLALWLTYVRCSLDVSGWSGERNFALPFVGWVAKVEEIADNVRRDGCFPYHWISALCLFSLLVQSAHTVVNWEPRNVWWRVGILYVVLGICLGTAVLEGYPAAYTRVLLPLQAAFNLSLQPTWKGWLLLVLGNLGVFQGLDAMHLL